MPTAQPAKLPYCGADAATEELVPEPSQDAMRLAELEAENQRLRDDLRHLQSVLSSPCRAAAAVSSSAQRLRILSDAGPKVQLLTPASRAHIAHLSLRQPSQG